MNETRTEKRGIYAAESAAALRGGTASPEFQTLHEIIKKARQNLDQNDWDYIVGGTESETTLRRNRMALDSLAFPPRDGKGLRRVLPHRRHRDLQPARARPRQAVRHGGPPPRFRP